MVVGVYQHSKVRPFNINLTLDLSHRYIRHFPLWPLAELSERFHESLKGFNVLGWGTERCIVRTEIIVDRYQDRIPPLAAFSEVVGLEVEGFLRKPIAVSDVMNDVRRVAAIMKQRLCWCAKLSVFGRSLLIKIVLFLRALAKDDRCR